MKVHKMLVGLNQIICIRKQRSNYGTKPLAEIGEVLVPHYGAAMS